MKKPPEHPLYKILLEQILYIEKELLEPIDNTEDVCVQQRLAKRTEMLGVTAKMLEFATIIYEEAKGEMAEVVLDNDKILNAKQDIQRKYFEGKLAEHSALWVRTERVVKSLDKSIEGLRSISSFNKSTINLR